MAAVSILSGWFIYEWYIVQECLSGLRFRTPVCMKRFSDWSSGLSPWLIMVATIGAVGVAVWAAWYGAQKGREAVALALAKARQLQHVDRAMAEHIDHRKVMTRLFVASDRLLSFDCIAEEGGSTDNRFEKVWINNLRKTGLEDVAKAYHQWERAITKYIEWCERSYVRQFDPDLLARPPFRAQGVETLRNRIKAARTLTKGELVSVKVHSDGSSEIDITGT